MVKPFFLIALSMIFQFCGLHHPIALPGRDPGVPAPSHELWDGLLRKHVDAVGQVNYSGFAGDRAQLQAYLDTLSGHVPGEHWTREARLAYYINLYNAGTVMLIVQHYPLKSIKDISDPWGRKFLRIGEAQVSLEDVEHGILRKMDEPRIHFAINCASLSCPRLQARAYTEKELEKQLQTAAREFVNDPLRNRFSDNKAHLSRIFKWFKGDFTGRGLSLVQFVNPYLATPLPDDARVEYLPYDWSLNDRLP
ncbi:DUF547 domain-containing protein [Robiginitalea marina]|uniref:DUF547 domain-containing protein n=1 Tax=Robiginitalea marina TaxID=2954105 RepID=A0ABT1AX61_9FLAO|nr:DUF547 domain-containing protein [Robiginitalea marina]MCO5724638.1 DUF547 domain-containing protein [Robiginitalea marina]